MYSTSLQKSDFSICKVTECIELQKTQMFNLIYRKEHRKQWGKRDQMAFMNSQFFEYTIFATN